MTFKEYCEWLFPYTDKLTLWSDYDCEYDKNLTSEEIDLRYKLCKFMHFCEKYNFSYCDQENLYDAIGDKFLVDVLIVTYNDKDYLLSEYNGQGSANAIEVISGETYADFGVININDMLEDGVNW